MKRGISPLIGTVLLIGFTIGLAMLIFTWGGSFVKDITEETGEEAIQKLAVLSNVGLDIKEVFYTEDRLQLKIENEKSTPIEEFIVRITENSGNVEVYIIKEQLSGFGIKTYPINHPIFSISKVEVIPKANINGELVTASNVMEEYKITEEETTQAILNNGAIFYTKLDSDPPIDLLGKTMTNNDATYQPTAGHDGFGAYEFDGIDDAISFTRGSWGYGIEQTYTAWIRLNTAQKGTIIQRWSSNNFETVFRVNAGRTLTLLADDSTGDKSITSITTLPLEEWHFVVGKRNSTHLALYINGVFENSVSFTSTNPINGVIHRIGASGGLANGGNFNGAIDDIIIFNRALSPEEIKSLYNR